MTDSTIKKIEAANAPRGDMGQTYLASGKRVAMRMWRSQEPKDKKVYRARPYETVGYVIDGEAELEIEGQTVMLRPGDSWVVPADAEHTYHVLKPFTAVEATAPPAQVHDRDEPAQAQ